MLCPCLMGIRSKGRVEGKPVSIKILYTARHAVPMHYPSIHTSTASVRMLAESKITFQIK